MLVQASAAIEPEHELMLLLAGTAGERSTRSVRIQELAASARLDVLRHLMARQRMLPLLGTRMRGLRSDPSSDQFWRAVGASLALSRRTALLLEEVGRKVSTSLRAVGVPVLVLKGPSLAIELYGDPGLRFSTDLDLLVPPERLDDARRVLLDRGYVGGEAQRSRGGRPLLHYRLHPPEARAFPVELHWRIHWYEEEFSRRILQRSILGEDGLRRPSAEDGLAALLLFYARDGLNGLRYPADIAAWWDVYRDSIRPGALLEMVRRHPALERPLAAAATAVASLVGVPVDGALADIAQRDRMSRVAGRLVNWTLDGSPQQIQANVNLVGWLLAPRAAGRRFPPPAFFSPQRQSAWERPRDAALHPLRVISRWGLTAGRLARRGRLAPLP